MLLYNIAISTYSLLIRLAAKRVDKAKLWHKGRVDLFKRMEEVISPSDRIVWIHVASLGEFEQGRPLIEKIKSQHPDYKILLTFFSPSGYEMQKKYKEADYIFYLPIDTTSNARRFLDITHPEIAIFVKYEYWLNLLFELRRRNIRSYIISAIFRRNSIFFKSWGSMWRRALESFETLFVQDKNSKEMLCELGFDNVIVAGDTRFDRVISIAQNSKEIPMIDSFKGDKQLLIGGSTWPADEKILIEISKRHPDMKFIFAPHEVEKSRIDDLMQSLDSRAVRYTEITQLNATQQSQSLHEAQILVVDTIGILSSLYRYSDFSYIGGGFGVGIHNTLEAATFGIPIAFGPNYKNFKEACDLISLGASQSISNVEELDKWLTTLRNNDKLYTSASHTAKEYTSKMSGATNTIISTIFRE